MNADQAAVGIPSDPTSAQPLGRATVAITAASALFVLSGYAINVTLGRALGPVDYGLFGVVLGLLTVINALQAAAIPQAIAKLTAERAEAASDLLLTGGVLQMSIGVALGIALFVLAGPLAAILGDPRLALPFQIAALAVPPYALFSLLSGFNGGRGRYSRQGLMLAIFSVAKAFLAISLGLLFALPGAIFGYVLAPVLAALVAGVRGVKRGHMTGIRTIVSYSAPLLLLALFSITHLHIDLFFVKSLTADPANAGYYTAAQNIARVPYFLSVGFAVILLPAVARASVHDSSQVPALVRDALRLGVLFIAPIAGLIAGASEGVVHLLYADAYSPAVMSLIVLSPAMACFALLSLLTSLLAGMGRAWRALGAAGAGLAATTLACSVLVPELGTLGAAASTLAGAVLALSIAGVTAVRVFSFSIPWDTVFKAGAVAAAIGLAAYMLGGAVPLLLSLPGLTLVYGLLLIVLGELKADDWVRIRRLLPS